MSLQLSFLDVDINNEILFGIGMDQILISLPFICKVTHNSIFLKLQITVTCLKMEINLRGLYSTKFKYYNAVITILLLKGFSLYDYLLTFLTIAFKILHAFLMLVFLTLFNQDKRETTDSSNLRILLCQCVNLVIFGLVSIQLDLLEWIRMYFFETLAFRRVLDWYFTASIWVYIDAEIQILIILLSLFLEFILNEL